MDETMDGVVRIPLNHGKYALVDAEDAPRIGQHRWHAQSRDGRWHAARGIRLGTARGAAVQSIWMHREIVAAPPGVAVTHLNGDGLDNRKANLRLADSQQRGAKRRLNKNNTSGYRGVSFDMHSGLWRAVVRQGGVYVSAGYYKTPEEAARAYDTVAKELFGEFAYQNLPAIDRAAREGGRAITSQPAGRRTGSARPR